MLQADRLTKYYAGIPALREVTPDRRDAFVIGHLPIRTRTIVAARLLAIAALMGLMALGTSLPSAILYGGMAGAFSGRGVIRGVIAHAAATMGASMFAFLLLLTLLVTLELHGAIPWPARPPAR